MGTSADQPLSDRAQILLKTLVEKYIEGGQPIGSKLLVKESGLDVSAATIRNVLGDLEDRGLIRSPHTSAGRVPTDKGYRIFVDRMIHVQPLQSLQIETIKQQMSGSQNHQSILTRASDLLSNLTDMTSLVMLPRRAHKSLRQIEFLPLSENRVLAIVVINEAEVENRVLQMPRSYTQDQLIKVANYLNKAFAGRDLSEVRKNLVTDLKEARQQVDEFMTSVVDMADRLFPEDATDDLLVTGKSNLLAFQDMADMDKLRQLFDTFKSKQNILEVLDQCLVAQNMQIFIGAECGVNGLDKCSIVTAPYKIKGEVVGVLGVVGPTRMAYNRVIPMVDITAKLLGSALDFKN